MHCDELKKRRLELRKCVPSGSILILSATNVPRNYAANTYPFHQDATFRYYTGLNLPDAALLIDDSGNETLFVAPPDEDDVIWTGAVDSPETLATRCGIENVADYNNLPRFIPTCTHWCAPYDGILQLRLATWLGISPLALKSHASRELSRAIIEQRLVKSDSEIEELEEAIGLTQIMLEAAKCEMIPGRREADVCAALLRPAIAQSRAQSFEPIVTTHGETLHSTTYRHLLNEEDLLLIDCGAESLNGYCADISRTFSIGKWNTAKREIYEAVLKTQKTGIAKTAEKNASQYDVHMAACLELTKSLIEIGLMKGNPNDAVAVGAHALFMPHGIGHALGLDAHDMENFGDDVGYTDGAKRSEQFGLNALRFHRKLRPGFVVTIEPGCYFIPELIDRWQAKRHLSDFICYDTVEKFRDMRGVRIEDDILITPTGSRVLGPGIDK